MTEKKTAYYVIQKAGTPAGPMINRPSIEYTGKGNLLCCDGWGNRYFRANEEWVREGCEKLKSMLRGDEANGIEGDWVNYSILYKLWGIDDSVMGYADGWSPTETKSIEFVFTMCGEDTEFYKKFGEPVFLIEPDSWSFPYKDYMEI